ncbi:phosphoribosyltransferase family protein [Pseudarthrobacter sp. NamB4]|uniref:phosphoribosyltransferase family protein n=1 Tax=Pseudarthrobacter sp. NamB4 TaxID=2576837 RepID=UPI0010FDF009|nr:phosphoribosyltransferase family protein [Pseudarthrobacter sp. NamB4]TLM70696.1 phosphoribosyltransferase [Pseudarthrobacter sp. NamB4]
MYEFLDRVDAGRKLGLALDRLKGGDVVVLGLPRGGVPVAAEVAKALDAPLDVIVVRKLGVPFQPEVAMGDIGEGETRVLDGRVVSLARVTDEDLAAVERRERALLEARLERYRKGRARTDLTGRTAVVVDDGIATGSTARAACQVARHLGAKNVVLAVPVAPAQALDSLSEADQVFSLIFARNFQAVGYCYRDFSPTRDEEVVQLLDEAKRRVHRVRAGLVAGTDQDVEIGVDGVVLHGNLHLSAHCRAVVVFAHGSGSSRHSSRNRYVASVLQGAGLGTLLLDLLTPAEEVDRTSVFDIALLGGRLGAATRWLNSKEGTAGLRVGYFGASTGAGAALWAAAESGAEVDAVVSSGGRPDLAGARLEAVRAPTLLLVGSADLQVLALNRQAMSRMTAPVRLEVIAGATHLFEEPGTLGQVAALAKGWFARYLMPEAATERNPEAAL